MNEFGIAWKRVINDDSIFIFGWTVPIKLSEIEYMLHKQK